jgi:hypothetical protein
MTERPTPPPPDTGIPRWPVSAEPGTDVAAILARGVEEFETTLRELRARAALADAADFAIIRPGDHLIVRYGTDRGVTDEEVDQVKAYFAEQIPDLTVTVLLADGMAAYRAETSAAAGVGLENPQPGGAAAAEPDPRGPDRRPRRKRAPAAAPAPPEGTSDECV